MVRVQDDSVLGSYVVFGRENSELIVDFENGGFSAWFDLFERGRLIRKVGIDTILRSVGEQDAVSYEARDLDELDREMRNLARLCETYAGRAITGEAAFYQELLG